MDAFSDDLVCFTDGSAINNGKTGCKAAFAVVWPGKSEYNYAAKISQASTSATATNNRAEYSAVIYALKQATTLDPTCEKTLHVYTDSQLLISSMTVWIHGWKKSGFKTKQKTPVANIDLVKELDALIQQRRTEFHHVKAHTNGTTWEAIHNDIVDKLAYSTANGI